eukprot:TRINITY_DN28199_c0_g1_i1.p1 TRINITY_DN28199_c0_g1~~TRINITY_DN28199_c0_g1_i1.p1  ORF type:complete len:146 (+),score=33.28 TRINITY_DN28199_c0_g1_i1:435-872(+)
MEEKDWQVVTSQFKLKKYQDGEPILNEGDPSNCIFQIASGSVVIQKKTPEGVHRLGTLTKGAMFGEMSFLVSGNATASIIAEGPNVQIYVLERTSLCLLFMHYPPLAGRFFSYLANVLASRLNEREMQVQRSFCTNQQTSQGQKD